MNHRPASYPDPSIQHPHPPHMGAGGGLQHPNGPQAHIRSAWSGSADFGRGGKLPPLEGGEHVMRSLDNERMVLALAAQAQSQANRLELEPLNLALSRQDMALGQQGRQQAALEERLSMLEQRLGGSEKMGSEVSRAFDIQNQRVGAMAIDLSRATAELNDLRLRYEGAMATNGQLQNQVMALAADLRQQDNKVTGLSAQLGESLRMNAEMRGQMAMMGDEIQRAAQDRSAASVAMERLTRQFQEGTTMLAEEGRRAVEEANAAFREESRRRQQQHLADLATLNREVDAYRQEATNAGAQLHSAVQSLHARLQSEEAQLDRLRTESAAMANSEAAQLGGLRGNIGELQNMLNAMGLQLQAEQAMRKNEAQALEYNMKQMEGQMMEAQEAVVKRTVGLMESKAAQFMKLIQDLEGLTAERDEETRSAGEQQMTAIVRTNARKEKAGLERLLVLEGALRDVANASAQSLLDLQSKLDQGLSELASMSESSKRAAEDREAGLREQVNSALQKIRAYARDMEESLDQERLRLEEVVKMEIKARIQTVEALKAEGATHMISMRAELKQQGDSFSQALDTLREEVHNKVMRQMREELEEQMRGLKKNIHGVEDKLGAEERARKQSDDRLQEWFMANAADAKLNEELLRTEIETLSGTVEETKRLLEEEIVEKVGHLRGDLDKLRIKCKADRKELDTLAELVSVHSEVFVDVQKKLDSLSQKSKTLDVQMKSMYEETGEKLAEMAEAQEGAKKENKKALDAAKLALAGQIAEVATQCHEDIKDSEEAMVKRMNEEMNNFSMAVKEIISEQGQKIEQQQTLLEDAHREIGTLNDAVKEQGEMLEDEVTRLEQEFDSKSAELSQQVTEKLEASEAKVTEQLEEADKKMESLDADTKEALSIQKEATLAAIASLEASTSDSLAAQRAELAEQMVAVEKSLSDQMDTEIQAVKSSMEAQRAELDDEMVQQRAYLDETSARLSDDVAEQKASVQQLNASVDTRMAESAATLDTRLAESAAHLDARLAETAASVNTRLADSAASMEQKLSDAAAESASKLDGMKSELQVRLEGVESQTAVVMGQLKEQVETALAGVSAQLESARLDTELGIAASRKQSDEALAAAVGGISGAVEGMQAEFRHSLGELQGGVEDAINGMDARMAEDRQRTETALADAGHKLAEAAAAADQKLAAAAAETDQKLAAAEQKLFHTLDAKIAAAATESASKLEEVKGEAMSAVAAVQASTEASLEAKSQELKQLEEKHQHVSGQLSNINREVQATLADAAATVDAKLAEVSKQVQEAERKLEAQEAAIQKTLDTQNAHMESTLAGINGDLQSVRDAVSEHTKELTNMLEDVADIQEKSSSAADSSERVAALEQQFNSRLAAIASDAAASKSAVDELSSRLEQQLDSRLAAVTSEAAASKSAMDELSSRLAEVNSLAKQVKEGEERMAKSDAQVQALQSAQTALEASVKSSPSDEGLSKKIVDLEGALVAQRQSMDQKLASQKEVIDKALEAQKTSVGQRLDTQKAEIYQTLNDQKAAVQQQISQVKDEVAASAGNKDDSDVKALKEEVQALKGEISSQVTKMAEELPKEIEKGMMGKLGDKVRSQAVADVEKMMHGALDDALVMIKNSLTMENIKPLQDEMDRLKDRMRQLQN